MSQYIRANVAGGTFFFTVNLAERKNNDLLIRYIDILRDAFRDTKNRHPFTIDAIVILPEHLHTIWTLPENDKNYSMRWRLIKTYFSRYLPKTERISFNRQRRNERGIWQRRFWEHAIRDEQDFANHVDYIHFNPVKHGYVKSAIDWQYSSFHRFVKLGVYNDDWGTTYVEPEAMNFGE
ncbi:MAG: transposase [Gammaproteobacteria bacterium]|nr:transposase [Gammaproteobacteria bacterium]